MIRKRFKIKGGLHHLTYLIRARCKLKKTPINMREARKEAWRIMLITSQNNLPPKTGKQTRTEIVQGVTVATFRIAEQEMIGIYGTNCLPILNPREPLAQKLMKEAHTIK